MPGISMKTECERCGTCCLKGGPALHIKDRSILKQNFLGREHLITIRRGEPVYSLEKEQPKPAKTEIIKLKGKESGWSCIFFNQEKSSCAIYEHRPLECVLLKCWDTANLESIAGKNLLSRFDIVGGNEPIIEFIQRHEEQCSLEVLEELDIAQNNDFDKNTLAELTDLVNKDLAVRYEAVNNLDISLDLELFYFGRPLFKILGQFSLVPLEEKGRLILTRA